MNASRGPTLVLMLSLTLGWSIDFAVDGVSSSALESQLAKRDAPAGALDPIPVDPLASDPNWSVEEALRQEGARIGASVSTAGDVNGDGYADVIIGAPLYDNGQADEGRVLVYFGSRTGLSSTVDWMAESNQAGAQFGFSVSAAGDVNHDGFDDIIVGAPYYDKGQRDEGRVFLWYGGPNGLGPNGTPSNAGWKAECNQAGAWFGYTVASAGDVNGDGYDDVVIGAPRFDKGQRDEGHVFVWLGGRSGLGANGTPSNVDWRAESNQAFADFGWSAGVAGDVNGDGYDDLIVGAPKYDNGQSNEGVAFVWLGSRTGLGANGSPANADWIAESNQAAARFGASVSTAGDINDDGFDEVLVGAPRYDHGETDEGAAFAWYGSRDGLGARGTPANPDWTAEGNMANAHFGAAVATAGDIDGNGHADVIVGAPDYPAYRNGCAFVYHSSETDLTDTASWAVSDATGGQCGFAVGTAGDVNGDGLADVVIGAPQYSVWNNAGQAWVYYGLRGGLSLIVNWTAQGNQDSAGFGYSVGTAGDVNGDGYDDVIVGAPYYDNGETNEGRAFVFLGTAAGIASTASWTAEGNQAEAHFGASVATAGDVNGDGYDDVIVGAPGFDNGQTNEGRVYIYLGSATGPSASPDWIAEGNQPGASLGRTARTAGDVNGDGYDDVIIGASERAFVYHGSSAGLSLTAAWMAQSDQTAANFGSAVSTAGDVNGDHFDDVIVGASHYDNPGAGRGRAFVYHGSAGGLSPTANWTSSGDDTSRLFGASVGTAGDVNGDGYDDVIIGDFQHDEEVEGEGRVHVFHGSLTGLGMAAAWIKESNHQGAYFGFSVSTAGDVNGDSYSDVIIGALFVEPICDLECSEYGRAYVYHGSIAGLSLLEAWQSEYGQNNADLGWEVSTAGDVNGDGSADVIIGAPGYDEDQTGEGAAYVYYGSGGRRDAPTALRAR